MSGWRALSLTLGILANGATVAAVCWALVGGHLPTTVATAMDGLTVALCWLAGILAAAGIGLGVVALADQRNPPYEL